MPIQMSAAFGFVLAAGAVYLGMRLERRRWRSRVNAMADLCEAAQDIYWDGFDGTGLGTATQARLDDHAAKCQHASSACPFCRPEDVLEALL